MDEQRTSQTDMPDQDESSEQTGMGKETAGSPRAGTTPSGPAPQGAGTGRPGGLEPGGQTEKGDRSYQPGQGGAGGGGYGPGLSEMAGGTTSRLVQEKSPTEEQERTGLGTDAS